jgi:16S rRNA (guanine1207-N2)-methyltransferase
MFNPVKLLDSVRNRVAGPTAILLGSPRQVIDLACTLGGPVIAYQQDLYQAERLRQELLEYPVEVDVQCLPDLWDLPTKVQTALLPITTHGERELKVDLLEQSYHILEEKGTLISLSEYRADQLLPKWHKKVFGKCSELPSSKLGSVFWSHRSGEVPRRRHEQIFHAKLKEHASREFLSRPGVFSYGRFDDGARALIEVAELRPGESVLDLGCGVGAVGILASDFVGPDAKIIFVDSNVRAIQLAELNARNNGLKNFETKATPNMEGLKPRSFDAILANPPYYASSSIATLFIEQSKKLLRPGGRFYLVSKMVNQMAELMLPIYPDSVAFENRGYHVLRGTVE